MKHGSESAASRYHVQVLDRAFAILGLLEEDGAEIGAAKVAGRLRLHKTTAHRMLAVLEHNEYIERSPLTGKYHLGWRLGDLGMRAISRMDPREIARPELARLVDETGETARLGVLRQGEVASIASVQSRRTLRTPATVGHRSPAHCSSQGKAILAFLTEEELHAFVHEYGSKAYTKNTLTRISSLRAELERIRTHGFAVDNEEFEEGLKCIGAPVKDYSGAVVAAISIAGPCSRLNGERMPSLVKSVKSAACRLSRSLGYRDRTRPS